MNGDALGLKMQTNARIVPTISATHIQAGKSRLYVTSPLVMVFVASGVCDHPNAPAANTMRKRKKVLRNAPFAVMCETRVDGGGAPVDSALASATGAAQPASSSFLICSKRLSLSAGFAIVSLSGAARAGLTRPGYAARR